MMMVSAAHKTWLVRLLTVIMLLYQIDHTSSHSAGSAPLLVIGFDGIRWDCLSKFQSQTPNFQKMAKNGVFATRGIKAVVETVTIPNFWSIVTGLYPESHGITSNFMVDPSSKKRFIPIWLNGPKSDNEIFYGTGGEPIWLTNQLQNTKGRSASFMWYGGNQPVKWIRPTLHVDYSDVSVSFEERVDTIVKWFIQENPINLALVYFPEPDVTKHKTGLESEETKEIMKNIDASIGDLFQKFEEKDLLDDINIIFTSDHGFVETPSTKLIKMDEIVPPEWYEEIYSTTPVFKVLPKSGMSDQIYDKLKEAAVKPNSHFQVFKSADIPESWHYKLGPRVLPVIAIADLGYSFLVNRTEDKFYLKATHGYSNEYQEMNPFFIAMGPSFKKGFEIDTFETVDIYPLMCHLLHVKPAPNNGSLARVSPLLAEAVHETTMWTFVTYIIVLIVIASVGGVFLVAACRGRNYLKRKIIHMQSLAQAKYAAPMKDAASVSFLEGDNRDADNDDDM